MVKYPELFHQEKSEDVPISSSDMKVRDMIVERCSRNDIRNFVEKWHYSKNINGVKSQYCFALYYKRYLIGAAIFSWMAMANVWKSYVDKEEDFIELRRLCCIDDTPRNTESYFIGHCMRWLRKNTKIIKIIAYSDPHYGHIGTIYKATNFKYLGQTSKSKVIVMGDRVWHEKTIRNQHGGSVKPYALKLKKSLELGKAHFEHREGKHIYLFNLR